MEWKVEAEVLISAGIATSSLRWRSSNSTEAEVNVPFLGPIPPKTHLSYFSTTVNGKKIEGKVRPKDYFRRIQLKSHGPETALPYKRLKENGHLLNCTIAVPPKCEVVVEMRLHELLERSGGAFRFVHLLPSGPPYQRHLRLQIRLAPSHPLSLLHIPANQPLTPHFTTNTLLGLPENNAKETLSEDGDIGWEPEEEELRNCGGIALLFDFDAPPGGTLLRSPVTGHFVHQISAPSDLPQGSKSLILAIDTSGSMEGRKMDEVKEGMKGIVERLGQRDVFNVVLFGRRLARFDHRPVRASPEQKANARAFIDSAKALGETNLVDGVKVAVEQGRQCQELYRDEELMAHSILLVTDGDTGQHMPQESLLRLVPPAWDVAFHGVALGDQADLNFLQRLSVPSGGWSRRMKVGGPIATELLGFYREFQTPLLKNLRLEYVPEPLRAFRLHPDLTRIYKGAGLIVAGRVGECGEKGIEAAVKGELADGRKIEWVVKESNDVPSAAIERAAEVASIEALLEEAKFRERNLTTQLGLYQEAESISLNARLLNERTTMAVEGEAGIKATSTTLHHILADYDLSRSQSEMSITPTSSMVEQTADINNNEYEERMGGGQEAEEKTYSWLTTILASAALTLLIALYFI